MEEHVTVVSEPESKYVGHLCLVMQKARGILGLHHQKRIETDTLLAIGCDGTNVNTGYKGGVIRLLEMEIGRSLQWLVCLLHANELPLRHLLQHVDGVTHVPRAFSGPIGFKQSKYVKTCW